MNKELFEIADSEGLTIAEVVTIFKISFVIDRNNELNKKYIGRPLKEIWETIPDKKYWLKIHNQNKDKMRKRKRR